jgi:hypothetical protein
MRHFKSGADLAKEIGMSPSKLEKVFTEYNTYASGQKKDPFGKKHTAFNIVDNRAISHWFI